MTVPEMALAVITPVQAFFPANLAKIPLQDQLLVTELVKTSTTSQTMDVVLSER